ncbi:lipid A biosynthesis acyltransferase [Nitrincola sp. MINF-07-Sa-05]|uniref:LpxL/LpxP family acyltransferase n=1 Tax=Nitrincola salilacus TaxID=3400273 RepID=UPI00391825F7
MPPAAEHWAKKRERGSYFGIQVLLFLYRYGGRWLILASLVPVLGYFFVTDRVARNASRDFLRRVHHRSGSNSRFSSEPGYWQSYCHFWQFALAALAKLDAWIGRITPDQVSQGGSVSFADLVASRTGGVLIGSHLGNKEVCRALVRSRYPTRINVLVFTRHARAFNRALKEANNQVDLNLIQVDGITPALTIMLKERVEQGEFVVIVGDRISAASPERSVWVDFLGQPAPFAIGPWVLASVLDCPVHLLFCMKIRQGYELTFEPFAERIRLPRKTRDADITQLVARYAERLEHFACRYPLQWFNFYDFWQLPAAVSQDKEAPRDASH